jgi:hypothetical protein
MLTSNATRLVSSYSLITSPSSSPCPFYPMSTSERTLSPGDVPANFHGLSFRKNTAEDLRSSCRQFLSMTGLRNPSGAHLQYNAYQRRVEAMGRNVESNRETGLEVEKGEVCSPARSLKPSLVQVCARMWSLYVFRSAPMYVLYMLCLEVIRCGVVFLLTWHISRSLYTYRCLLC